MMYHLFRNSFWKLVRIAKTSDCKISRRVFLQGTVSKNNSWHVFLFFGCFQAHTTKLFIYYFFNLQLETAPPLRDEIIVDRATQNSARNRYDNLKKEADELNVQSHQMEEAFKSMSMIQTR